MSLPQKVLVVDDEQHIRFFLTMMLKEIGVATIVEANNGKQAIEVYTKEKPDAVLMDVNMPLLDGIGALKEIMKLNPETMVVMLTSIATRQSVDECLELGACNYIRKDLSKQEMTQTLKETLNQFNPSV